MQESRFYRAEIFVIMPHVAHNLIGIDYVVPDSRNFLAYQRAVLKLFKPEHGFLFHQCGSEGAPYQCFEFWSETFNTHQYRARGLGEKHLPVKEIEARIKFCLPELYLVAQEEYDSIARCDQREVEFYGAKVIEFTLQGLKERAKNQRESQAVLV